MSYDSVRGARGQVSKDLEIDLRNGWIEKHKAMVELRAWRELVLLQNKMVQYGAPSPIAPASVIAD